jgi:hypothetical protein
MVPGRTTNRERLKEKQRFHPRWPTNQALGLDPFLVESSRVGRPWVELSRVRVELALQTGESGRVRSVSGYKSAVLRHIQPHFLVPAVIFRHRRPRRVLGARF